MKPKPVEMYAYPDQKCSWGYMLVCDDCKGVAPPWVDIGSPIREPPAAGKEQPCEICYNLFILKKAESDHPCP